MSETLLVLGIILGLTLSGLLVCTIACEKFKFWPTPGKGTWQSLLFWGLFRGLNVTTLTMGFVCFQPWQDFYPERVARARHRDPLRPPLRCGRSMPLAAKTSTAAAMGSSPAASTPGRAIRNTQRQSRPFSSSRLPLTRLLFPRSRRCLSLCFALMAFAEERWLEAAYGAEYLRYRREVARFYNWRHALALLKQEFLPTRRAAEEPVSERP